MVWAINWPGKKSARLVEMNTSANTRTPLFVGEKANSRARRSEQAQSGDFTAKGKYFPFKWETFFLHKFETINDLHILTGKLLG